MAAGCLLSADNLTEITGWQGGSVLLPCSCSDLNTKPQKLTWETYRTGRLIEVLNNEHYSGRLQLFNNTSPANLSLLISDLKEEDQQFYRCRTEEKLKDIMLYVKGCELVKKTEVEHVTVFTGESVVLPCVCTDIQDKPQGLKWEFYRNNQYQEIYPKQTGHHRNKAKLVSNNSPGNLSLLISDLTEEDQGDYTCSVQNHNKTIRWSVKGRRETSTHWRETDTKLPSEKPQSKTTDSPPASSSTTLEQGCALSGDNLNEITRHRGDSVLLPCSCSHLNTKPQKLTWETGRTGHWTEVLNDEHYSGRVQLFNNISPANLSLFISDLRVEDQGNYRCSTGPQEHREISLYVDGCELVKKAKVEHVSVFTGESVVLPCVCTDIQDKPQGLKWEFYRNNQYQEIYPKQTGHHRNRFKLVSNNSPGNLSLLISHLTEEDQGDYRCSVQNHNKTIRWSVKVGRRETSTHWRETDTKPPSEKPQSKTTDSPPASSSTTLEQGCALSGDHNVTEITRHRGDSVLLPCSCSHLNTKPQKLTWVTGRTGNLTEMLNDKHYSGRLQLFNNISPANLSLLISDLRVEDQGDYRCSTGPQEYRDISLYVNGCELVKKTEVEHVSVFTGESVVLPCVCTDIQDKPQGLKWEFYRNNQYQEIYPKQTGHHRNRFKLVSNNSPGNLSLLISHLTEEDQGDYRCSVQNHNKTIRWSVKGGRCGENVITEGRQDCKRKQKDQEHHSVLLKCGVLHGCTLSAYNDQVPSIRHRGDSVLLPCSCSDLNTKPQKLTWGTFRTGHLTEVLNEEHYSGRLQLFNNISPANLSLLISDLRVEDQGYYRCSTEKEYRDIWLPVKGCELVKKKEVERVTVFTGESVVLPCVCTDLQDKPQGLKWEFYRNNHYQEIYPKQTGRHRNRVKLTDAVYANVSHNNKAGTAHVQINTGEETEYACIKKKTTTKKVEMNGQKQIGHLPSCSPGRPSRPGSPIMTFVAQCALSATLWTGCELVKKTGVEHVTVFTGESVVLPCVCTDIQNKSQGLKWQFFRINQYQEVYPKQTGHHRDRVKLVSNNSPGNLSLLISHLTEEDQGDYRCSVHGDRKDIRLSVRGRKETSINLRKTNTTPSSKPQSKTTNSPPASSSTTLKQDSQQTHSNLPLIFGISVVLLLVILTVVALICWRCRGQRHREKVNTDEYGEYQDCKIMQK
ncbi:polymeric immunoglobulin receptor-like isoform X3, partial [Clarias magur]